MMEYRYFDDGTTWLWDDIKWRCTKGPIINQPCSSGPVCVGGEG